MASHKLPACDHKKSTYIKAIVGDVNASFVPLWSTKVSLENHAVILKITMKICELLPVKILRIIVSTKFGGRDPSVRGVPIFQKGVRDFYSNGTFGIFCEFFLKNKGFLPKATRFLQSGTTLAFNPRIALQSTTKLCCSKPAVARSSYRSILIRKTKIQQFWSYM